MSTPHWQRGVGIRVARLRLHSVSWFRRAFRTYLSGVRLLLLVILIVSIAVLVILLRSRSASIGDIGANLFAELVGVLITVGLIGWLLDRERRVTQTRLLRGALLGPLMRLVNLADDLILGLNPSMPDNDLALIARKRGEWLTAAVELSEGVKLYTAAIDANMLQHIATLENLCREMTSSLHVREGQKHRVPVYLSGAIPVFLMVRGAMQAIEPKGSPFLETIVELPGRLNQLGEKYGVPTDSLRQDSTGASRGG